MARRPVTAAWRSAAVGGRWRRARASQPRNRRGPSTARSRRGRCCATCRARPARRGTTPGTARTSPPESAWSRQRNTHINNSFPGFSLNNVITTRFPMQFRSFVGNSGEFTRKVKRSSERTGVQLFSVMLDMWRTSALYLSGFKKVCEIAKDFCDSQNRKRNEICHKTRLEHYPKFTVKP